MTTAAEGLLDVFLVGITAVGCSAIITEIQADTLDEGAIVVCLAGIMVDIIALSSE